MTCSLCAQDNVARKESHETAHMLQDLARLEFHVSCLLILMSVARVRGACQSGFDATCIPDLHQDVIDPSFDLEIIDVLDVFPSQQYRACTNGACHQ